MDNNPTPKNFFNSLVFKILLGIGGIILIVVGVYYIFLKGKVSNDFIVKFNEINQSLFSIQKEVQDLSTSLQGLEAKEQAKDYAGAVEDLNVAIQKLDEISSKNAELKTQVADFKTMVNEVSDASVKTEGLKFVGLVEQTNVLITTIIDENRQIENMAKNYYEDLASSKNTSLDQAQLTALLDKIDNDSKVLANLINQWGAANQDLAKAAGFKLTPLK